MKRWFRVVIISIFALAAVSLVVIQLIQTRRTLSISDNMFSVSVGNAMEDVINQLDNDSPNATTTFNYQDLDSLIVEELIINGIDLHPSSESMTARRGLSSTVLTHVVRTTSGTPLTATVSGLRASYPPTNISLFLASRGPTFSCSATHPSIST